MEMSAKETFKLAKKTEKCAESKHPGDRSQMKKSMQQPTAKHKHLGCQARIHILPCAARTVSCAVMSQESTSAGSLELTFCWHERALTYCTVLIDLMAFSYKGFANRKAGLALPAPQNLLIQQQWIFMNHYLALNPLSLLPGELSFHLQQESMIQVMMKEKLFFSLVDVNNTY